MSQPLPPKKEVAIALLERSSVHVHLDPRSMGVTVPPWFKKQPQLVLQVGLNMPVPIPDLTLDDDALSCTLSFNRSPFFCLIPWSAIFALVGDDGRGMVWPETVPPELSKPQGAALRVAPDPSASPAEGQRKRPALAAVPSEPAPASRAKKGKKKGAAEVADRPMLVAVGPSSSKGDKRPRVEPEKKPAAGKPARPSAAAKKPKRELPPYLRVVK